MKILLTGAAGQLGRELRRSLAPLGAVIACDRTRLDLADAEALRRAVRDAAPDVIVNAAAWTAVDKAEEQPAAAQAINATAPAILAEEARRLGARLIHYSTDYVFDGQKSAPYVESDACAPLGVYGRSKRAGEEALAAVNASGGRATVLRTSWVFGLHGANFMKTMLRLGREREELGVVADQIGAPTWTRHLADLTALLLARDDTPTGLYHCAAAGATSWHGYAEEIFAQAVALGLLARAPLVRRLTSAEYPLPAPRPANSRLDCTRLATDSGLRLPDWREGLAACLADAIH